MDLKTNARQGCISETHLETFAFSMLRQEELSLLEEHTVEVEYRKGDVIAKQGALASHVLYLESGLVKIFLEGYPKDLILSILPPGSFFGLTSLFEGNQIFLHSAATYEDSRIKMTDIGIMKQLLSSNAAFAMNIISILNEATSQLYGRFYCLSRKQSHGRVADVLLCLSERVYASPQFHLGLSRSDLADLTGLTSESVIRILKEFKDEGIIESRAKDVSIIDMPALQRISQLG